MAYPPGWTINESWPGRIELTSPGADARIVINAEFTNKGVDEWVEETLGNLSRRLWYFELLFKERYKKGQLEGWIVGYKGRPPFGSPSEYRDLMASDRELQYWVSAYTWNNFQDYVPLLELAVRSFQLAAPPATPLPWWQTGK